MWIRIILYREIKKKYPKPRIECDGPQLQGTVDGSITKETV